MLDAVESIQMTYPSPRRENKNKPLELRETVIVGKMEVNTTNSVYKIQRQLFARSERVKGIDFHPVEPWILTTLYSGMLKSADHTLLLLTPLPSRPCLHMVVRDSSMYTSPGLLRSSLTLPRR